MTGNSMKSDLLVESHNRMTTNTTDGRQQGLAIVPGHTIDTNSTNNNNNNTNQTIGIGSTSTHSNNSTNNTSNSSSHSNTRMIMSRIISSSVENGDLVAGTNNVVSPDLTLAIQENLKYGVDLSGLGRELLSRDTNRPHPAATTSSSEGIRGTSSSISINNNNTSNNTNTTTTNNNNNNGLYENGSSMDGSVSLLLPTTTEDTRGTVTNMTPSLYVAFSNPTTTSGSSTSSSTTITGSVTTINSYKNNNHNGTAAHPPPTDLNKNNNNLITNNTTSPDPTSGGCSDPSSNNIHNNSTPVFSINNITGGTTSTGPLLPLSTSLDPYPPKQQCPVTDNTSESKLKELLLLHIDFIHHQQDLLLQKDREIGDLKSENETLKCRLDRMERRLSILKQKGEPVNSHHHHHHHHMPKNQANSDALTTTGDRGNKKFNFLKRRERKFGVDAQNLQKKKGGSETTPKSKSQSLTKNRLSYRSNDSVNRCQELSENGDVILRTDNLYYVSYYEPPRPSEKLVVNIRHTNDEINPDGSKVEIPHWRLRPVANCYTLEGTENLEDEVFTKRHQKPELEEKRRKRWDLQRLREQKLSERLREKGKPYPENMKDEHQFITSFYPSLDDITHIEIADKVPVTAFGHPIPYIKPTDFELPWELGEWPSTSSSSGEDNRHQKHRRVKRK